MLRTRFSNPRNVEFSLARLFKRQKPRNSARIGLVLCTSTDDRRWKGMI